jgi:hypothetical protein
MAAGTGERRVRDLAPFVLALAAVVALATLPFVPAGGLGELYDRTLGYQLDRPSPFSIWGLEPALAPAQTGVKAAALALAVLVFFFPRRRTLVQVAALGGAVLVTLELAATHWFYLYVAWFTPLALVAFLGPLRQPDSARSRGVRAPITEPQSASAIGAGSVVARKRPNAVARPSGSSR